MVLINGTDKFIVYDLDTLQSVLNRLAVELRTIPKYLYFPKGVPTIKQFHEEANIDVEDLLEFISGDTGYSFVPIFEALKDKLGQQKLNLREDILMPYVAFNKQFRETPDDMRGVFILMMQSELDDKKIFPDKQNIIHIWENREKTERKRDLSINSNDSMVKKQLDMFKQFEDIDNPIPYSPFELELVNFEFVLDIAHLSIMELFNQLQLTPGVPFAGINSYFKILKDFVPLTDDWEFYLEDKIIFKVLQKSNLISTKPTDYTDAILSILGEPGEEVVTVKMSLLTSGQYLSRAELIDRFTSIIKGWSDIKVKKIKESKVNGVFYFPLSSMNKYVFSDLVMNNSLFSSIISIDESEKASKKKESVYIHFNHPKIGHVAANITEKISDKGDQNLRGKDVKKDFKFGTKYIRVKVSTADNLAAVKGFQEMMSKLMIIYHQEYQPIVNFYRQYIPDFAKIYAAPANKPTQTSKLKDIAPEVFIKGYPPKCPHQPTIIRDDEVKKAEKEGKAVMRYSQDEKEGFIPRNYICNHTEAIYPGLRKNPLANRNKIPYLPCCYVKNHADKTGSIYRHYYYGDDLKIKGETKQQDLIVTNKFVPKDNYGTLPEDITKMFNIFNYQDGFMYVRKGVFNTKSSFLDCVMEGMYVETNILSYTDEKDRANYLYQVREKLAVAARAASASQEMFDFTTEEIIAATKDPDVYLKPSLFTALLEEFFDCNIYVFNRNNNNRNGQLILPRHLQAYYKTKRRKKCIFIYEHMGSISDHATYPRCELIVRWRTIGKEEKDVSYYSTYDSKIGQGVRKVFNQMRKAYALNVEIGETDFSIKHPEVKLIGQGIDSYGKCRMIRFKYKGYTGTLLTSPIQPFAISKIDGWVATKLKQNVALKFAKLLNISISGQSIVRDVVKELYGVLGNVRISIPVEDDSVQINIIPFLDKGISYPEKGDSIMKNYNKYKKLARYIVEYTLWLFSQYLHANSKHDMGLDSISAFQKANIKIDPDFKYGNVGKLFGMDSGVMNGGKLVVKSEEALKRLMYTLRISIRRHRQKIINYRDRHVIENYYVDVTDFDQHHFQVILHGDESVKKWINEQKIKYYLYDSVQVERRTPYFFQNPLVSAGQIYLAQNTHNLLKAIRISEIWQQSRYNPGENPGENPDPANAQLSIELFAYSNPTNIIPHKVAGVSTQLNIKMLGYKIDDKSFFTVLLQL